MHIENEYILLDKGVFVSNFRLRTFFCLELHQSMNYYRAGYTLAKTIKNMSEGIIYKCSKLSLNGNNKCHLAFLNWLWAFKLCFLVYCAPSVSNCRGLL